MSAIKEKKSNTINEIKQVIDDSSLVVFANYLGLSVSEFDEIRSDLKSVGTKCKVYKNTLVLKAFEQANIQIEPNELKGPMVYMSTNGDIAEVTKKIVKHTKSSEKFVLRNGVLDGEKVSNEELISISKLPSKEVMLGKLVGSMNAPVSNFVYILNAPLQGFALALKNYHDKKKLEESNV